MTEPCPNAACVRGLVGDDVCPACNGSGEAEPAPKRKPAAGALATFARMLDARREPARVADAPRLAVSLFDHVLIVDAKCVAAGMPAMSPWWQWSIGTFLATGKPWGVWNIGRGAGKSTTFERVAAAITRYAPRRVPPGQTWTMPFISVGPDDANRRINGIAAVFRADGLAIVGDVDEEGAKVKPGDGVRIVRAPRGALDLVDARGNPIQLASIAGTVGNVSGPSTVALMIDEAAKLHDRVTNANPLTEIIASASQTSRSREGWVGLISSSAYDRTGVHFQLVERGDNETTFVARIGAAFLDDALAGFEDVAAWEQRRGDTEAARIIREHAASLRADSPLVPTWTGNPTLGNPACIAWPGAALATRMLVEVLPEEALEGVPRVLYWLRENASVAMDRGAGGANAEAQCRMAAALTRRVNDARNGRPSAAAAGPMPIRGAPIGDPRYAGPDPTMRRGGGGLAKRRIF